MMISKTLRRSPLLLVAAALLSAAHGTAQEAAIVPFPYQVLPQSVHENTLEFAAKEGALLELLPLDSVLMVDVPLPDRKPVTLELQRSGLDMNSFGVHVNGAATLHDLGDLSLWQGQIYGEPNSYVTLGFSSYGTYGWIRSDLGQYDLMAFVGPNGNWSQARLRMVPDSVMQNIPAPAPNLCQSHLVTPAGLPPTVPDNQDAFAGTISAMNAPLRCDIAIETDHEYYQLWNNLPAAQNYTFILLGAVSDRYFADVQVRLEFPYVQFYTTPADPWTQQGAGAGALLNEFRTAWEDNIPANAHLGHLLSGADTGGGVAYIDVLCNQAFGFGVSGNIDAGTQFPVMQGAPLWDFFIVSHELGHNFGSVHTHDFCPPLDECADPGAFGQCQTQRTCINSGTIMSYCHTCPGGTGNIHPEFHPAVKAVIRTAVDQSCLFCETDPLEPNDNCNSPAFLFGSSYTGLTVCETSLDHYTVRVFPGENVSFQLLFDHSLGDINCVLYQSPGCISLLATSYSTTDNESVSWTNTGNFPEDVVLAVYAVGPGTRATYDMTAFIDNADPCGGNPDGYEPNDFCPPGFTLPSGFYQDLNVSQLNRDFYAIQVDAGDTAFCDLQFDHSLGDINMVLRPMGDPQCGQGSAHANALAFAISTTDHESLSWVNNSGATVTAILEVSLADSGQGLQCNEYEMILRNSLWNGGATFCDPMDPNSTGEPTTLFAVFPQGGALQLEALQGPPNQFAYFLVGSQVNTPGVPLGSGRLCLAVLPPALLGRYNVASSALNSLGQFDSGGVLRNLVGTGIQDHGYSVAGLPFAGNPPILSGDTWHFQLWHREAGGDSNFSNGLTITF